MKNYYPLLFCFLFFAQLGFAQKITELPDPKKPTTNSEWLKLKTKNNLAFSKTDYSYAKHIPPSPLSLSNSWTAQAWKGEKIHTQLAFWSNEDHDRLAISSTQLVDNKGNKIASESIKLSTITYVITDLPGDLKMGCGISTILDSALVADRITADASFQYEKNTTRPLWLSIKIPANSKPGLYHAAITITGDNLKKTIPYTVNILDHELPDVKNWDFHLDLWQNPFAIARQEQVKLWSDEHFDSMKPHYQRLHDAGQKNITASIINDPWNGQTYDKYQAMIQWTKKKDGSWTYDYSIFDKWVKFMRGIGFSRYINCYSMIPWNMNFQYFDEATGKNEILILKTDEPQYKNHWLPLLKDFARHLKETGEFKWTTIAMDERPEKDMERALLIIKEADPDFQLSLAGAYHPKLADQFADYSITLAEDMDPEILKNRKAKGYKTTFYTCCTEIFPNTFTNSGYQEATWLAWHAVQRGFDGYLRWAFDSWNANPNLDTRHGSWLGGDTYFVYPNNNSSIRFEKLIAGIQDAEKINILRKKLSPEKLRMLEEQIAGFSNKNINPKAIPQQLLKAKNILNSL